MKIGAFMPLFLFCTVTVWGQKEEAAKKRFTLEDCLSYAYTNNITLQSKRLSEEAESEIYRFSKQGRFPTVGFSLSENFSHSGNSSGIINGNVGINANVTLYSGGSINKGIAQNKLFSEQATYSTSQYINSLTIQIMEAFLSVLSSEELLKYQEALVEAGEEQIKQGEEQYKRGVILESDYLLLQAQYASDLDNLVNTRSSLDINMLNLKALLSIDLLEELVIVYPDTAIMDEILDLPDIKNIIDKTMNTLPDIKISQYNMDIAKLNVGLAKAAYYPTIRMTGSIGTGHVDFSGFGQQLQDQFSQQIGLSLSVPIYSAGKIKSNVVQAKIGMQQAELDYQNMMVTVRQTVIEEYRNVVSAQSKFNASSMKRDAYWNTYKAYQARFNVGDVTPVDLLQQQNNYINALNEYIRNKYGLIFRRKVLDVYMGEMPVKQ